MIKINTFAKREKGAITRCRKTQTQKRKRPNSPVGAVLRSVVLANCKRWYIVFPLSQLFSFRLLIRRWIRLAEGCRHFQKDTGSIAQRQNLCAGVCSRAPTPILFYFFGKGVWFSEGVWSTDCFFVFVQTPIQQKVILAFSTNRNFTAAKRRKYCLFFPTASFSASFFWLPQKGEENYAA